MTTPIDYSKFEAIERAVVADEAAERAAKEAEKQRKKDEIAASDKAQKAKGKALGEGRDKLRPPAKYVDSDGDTVSGPSDGEDSDDDSDDDGLNEDEDLHPLFWRRMPKPGTKGYETAKILEDLVYKNDEDEPKHPNELAADFKEKGNEFFQWGRKYYKRALQEYKEALQWARKGDDSDDNKKCYAAILSNRAAINLKLGNNGSVVRDCEAAIKYGPDPLPNCKTHFRAACACTRLGKLREATTFVEGGLAIDAENPELLKLKKTVAAKLKEQKRVEREKERVVMEERRKDEQLRKDCLARGFHVGPLVSDIEVYLQGSIGNKTRGGFPRPGRENQSMQWAVMLMYPEHMQSEFIHAFDLTHSFRDHLQVMFPASRAAMTEANRAPWDEQGNYTVDEMEVYMEERVVHSFDMNRMWETQYTSKPDKVDWSKRRRVHVPLDKTLGDCLADPDYVIPGVPTFFVVSKASSYYVETFCPEHKGRLRIL
ncbi:Tetratricopeptide repeat protein 4-like [Hondaea fermentalgiana]|uniref:Tetratricopeptide repeat protein 4-like n=1 Tax=Hondaea fermentalgiana TaxID=2315210 RepID=A0A2R5GNK4_9STRA|nr:Tetratricopeptide repeat protein 4-like [Hondaea fermentalgiana]|eukprot:GBG32205.1 Tetratricopeptide repeat protein 4-like [Hondaea fermentalgiana]